MFLGSLGRTCWGSEGRVTLGLDSPPLSASYGETEGCSEPPNSEGRSGKLGSTCDPLSQGWVGGDRGQNFGSFAQSGLSHPQAHSALKPAEPLGPMMSPCHPAGNEMCSGRSAPCWG